MSQTLWYGQQDLNLHARALEPKSNVSANSTMPAYELTSVSLPKP